LGSIIKLCQNKRGIQTNLSYSGNRAVINYEIPLNEVVFDFNDRLKSMTSGYASFDYEIIDHKEGDLVKMNILVNSEPVDALAMMIHKDFAQTTGREVCEKLKDLIPRHNFMIPVQAAIGGKIIARETIKGFKKDVLTKIHGGGATDRKRKLLEKQKKGKARSKQFGRVEIPQEAFIGVLKISKENLSDFLGVPKFKSGELESENRVGIVTGLAWTEYGGEILKIETATMPGKGRMQITGKLGDVMQESVKAAKSFVRSKCLEYGIIPPLFEKKDFHIHVPEGATPKDGPSAGIGMVTSIVSSITNIPVKRDVAMTGEVTLTGQVLPIGGLKEKLIAAHRAGIKEVLIPKENEKDLVDMPIKIIDEIKITPVEYADEVLKIALTKELKKTEWVEVDISKKDDKSQASIQ